MTSPRVLVADDDPGICRILRGYLEQAGMTVLLAYDGESALQTIRRDHPDLLALDIMLPKRDGLELTRLVRADPKLAATPIILITARVEDTDKIIGLEMGADDYVVKPFNAQEVVARVRAQLRRHELEQNRPGSIVRVEALELVPAHFEARLAGQPLDLTPTEFKILLTLAENARHTVTRDELSERALGYAYEGLGRALDTHIRNLRQKMDPRWIQTMHSVGYRLTPPED